MDRSACDLVVARVASLQGGSAMCGGVLRISLADHQMFLAGDLQVQRT